MLIVNDWGLRKETPTSRYYHRAIYRLAHILLSGLALGSNSAGAIKLDWNRFQAVHIQSRFNPIAERTGLKSPCCPNWPALSRTCTYDIKLVRYFRINLMRLEKKMMQVSKILLGLFIALVFFASVGITLLQLFTYTHFSVHRKMWMEQES